MLEFFTTFSKDNAISILKDDHDKVKDLFEDFENAETLHEKKKIAAEAIHELKIHATIEEEIFYPTVRRQIEDIDIMNEANEEHHVAKLLIAELDQMDGHEEHYEAKFKVLAENIRHHIKEEEGDMFPKVMGLDIDLEALGERMLGLKQQLKSEGIPASAEERMVAHFGAKADSPAQNARKRSGRAPARKSTAHHEPHAHGHRKHA